MKKILLLFFLLFVSSFCFAQSRYISESTKKIVYARDGGSCQCCGSSSNLEYDHIQPYSCGGTSEASNVQLLCLKCNRSKSNSCYCKFHNKKVGVNCCKDRKNKKTSVNTNSPAAQCSGTTKKGARCKKTTRSASGRCHLHD